jgi:hypothetical protein
MWGHDSIRRTVLLLARHDGVLVADESLRVELEGFAHELGDAMQRSAMQEDELQTHFTYPQTTTSSIMLPQSLATVELSLELAPSTESSSNRFLNF